MPYSNQLGTRSWTRAWRAWWSYRELRACDGRADGWDDGEVRRSRWSVVGVAVVVVDVADAADGAVAVDSACAVCAAAARAGAPDDSVGGGGFDGGGHGLTGGWRSEASAKNSPGAPSLLCRVKHHPTVPPAIQPNPSSIHPQISPSTFAWHPSSMTAHPGGQQQAERDVQWRGTGSKAIGARIMQEAAARVSLIGNIAL